MVLIRWQSRSKNLYCKATTTLLIIDYTKMGWQATPGFLGGKRMNNSRRQVKPDKDSVQESRRRLRLLCEKHAEAGKWNAYVATVKRSTVDDWDLLVVGNSSAATSAATVQTTTPLHVAALYGAPAAILTTVMDICRTQFNIAAPAAATNDKGNTALHIAVASAACTTDIVDVLCGTTQAGILPAILRNAAGRTALHVATCWSTSTTPTTATTTTTTTTTSTTRQQQRRRQANKSLLATSNDDVWQKRRQVVQALLGYYPAAAAYIDNGGHAPLYYWKLHPHGGATIELRLKRLQRIHGTANKTAPKQATAKELQQLQAIVQQASCAEDASHHPTNNAGTRTISDLTFQDCWNGDDDDDNNNNNNNNSGDMPQHPENEEQRLDVLVVQKTAADTTLNTSATTNESASVSLPSLAMCNAWDPVLEQLPLWQCHCGLPV